MYVYIIAHTVLLGSYIHNYVGCWLPSSCVQFALLDISRQLACMKLGSRGKYQPLLDISRQLACMKQSNRQRPVYGDLFKKSEVSTWTHSFRQSAAAAFLVSFSGSS